MFKDLQFKRHARHKSKPEVPKSVVEARGYSGGHRIKRVQLENKLVPNTLKELDHALYRINLLTKKIEEMEQKAHEEEMTGRQYQRLIDKEEEYIKKCKLDVQENIEPRYKKFKHVSETYDFESLHLIDKNRKAITTNQLLVKQSDAKEKLLFLKERLEKRIEVL